MYPSSVTDIVIIIARCYTGHFVNGNATHAVYQRFQCLGNAGEWMSTTSHLDEFLENKDDLQPCFPAPGTELKI